MVGCGQMRVAGPGTAICALASAALAEAPAGCADGRRIGTMLTGEWPTGPVRSACLDNASAGAERIAAVTHAAADGPERVTLAELTDRYCALGLVAAGRGNFGPTCLCD
jgi:hypothetical protein